MKNQFLLLASLCLSWGGRAFWAFAFAPAPLGGSKHPSPTTLDATRRDVVTALLLGSGAAFFQPYEAKAFSQQLDDYAFEPQQQATDGKFDLNSAFVVSHS
jgi:hypothetical protein